MTNVLDYRLYYDVVYKEGLKMRKTTSSNIQTLMYVRTYALFITFVLVQDANSSLKKAFQICIILRKFSVTVLKQKCY